LKKINYKKVLTVLVWIVAIAGLLGSLAFVSKKEGRVNISGLNIVIHNNDENLFLSEEGVRKFFEDRNEGETRNLKRLDIAGLEKALNSHPAVENAEVSENINGELKIEITQRTPVLRIINKDGESYYIDSHSRLMSLNENYSARVMVANGEIFEPFARRYQFSVEQIGRSKVFSEVSLLDDIVKVNDYIRNDSALVNLVQQIYVNKDKELELYPIIGNHRIIFGKADDVAAKFNKLKLFYTQGLNKLDAWTKYSTINLKYKNLVVCTKK
jgi:cell division protein FtsQ